MASAKKIVKPIAAALGLAATMASVWWFAFKPRRKERSTTEEPGGS